MRNNITVETAESQVRKKTEEISDHRPVKELKISAIENRGGGRRNSMTEVIVILVDEGKTQVVVAHHQTIQTMEERKTIGARSEAAVADRTGEVDVKKVLLAAEPEVSQCVILDFSS